MKRHLAWACSLVSLAPVCLLAGTVLACAGSEASTGAAPSEPAAGRLQVYRGDLVARVLLTGELEAEDGEQLVVPNTNTWPVQVRWLAEDGAEVRQGDKVAEFDDSQLAANLEEMIAQAIEAASRLSSLQAQAAGEEAKALLEIEKSRAAAEKARLEADVPAEMFPALEFQKWQLDWRKAELELAKTEAQLQATREAKVAEIDIQRIALEKARSQVVRSQSKIDLLVLHAARDGILILGTDPREGRMLQAGDSVFPGNVIARLPDLGSMIVSARLFDVDDGRIEPGMRVTATLDAFPDQTFTGQVREIDQIADQASRRSLRRFFRARIDLDELDVERMRPGMSVKVVIDDLQEDVLLVPRPSLDWADAGSRALLADGSWVPVTLGACDRAACVVEDGLEEGAALGRVGTAAGVGR
ncbi:MAG: efflux RND transporter periplasmic adaptor subunit [Acidobacteriota bacterium]